MSNISLGVLIIGRRLIQKYSNKDFYTETAFSTVFLHTFLESEKRNISQRSVLINWGAGTSDFNPPPTEGALGQSFGCW